MNKNKIMLIAALSLMFCFVPAFAAERIIPTPPSWVEEEEYVVFENSSAYEPEIWDRICVLRTKIESNADNLKEELNVFVKEYVNANDAGLNFETGLLYYKYYLDNYQITSGLPDNWFEKSAELTDYGDKQKIAYMWHARASLPDDFHSWNRIRDALCKFADYPDYKAREIIVNKEIAKFVGPNKKLLLETPLIAIDKSYPELMKVSPEVKNGRIMLPIRSVVENIGGSVEWNAKTNEIVIVRTSDTLKLTVGSNVAYKNNKAIMLDAEPYIKNGNTFLPVRFVAEQLGQVVTWAEGPQIVGISENKDASKNSNLEMWIKPMGAYLIDYERRTEKFFTTGQDIKFFTGYPARKSQFSAPVRRELGEVWSIYNREDLLGQIESLTKYGHNSEFLKYVGFINSMTKKEYEQLLKEAKGMGIDEYMFPLTKELAEKWEGRGIMAWDLFRVANLVQWGYMAGYLTYNEALAAAEPAAKKLQQNFSSWEEAYDNYVDGHIWWSRTDVRNLKYEEWGRRPECKEMIKEYKELFDNSLFKGKIISVDGVDFKRK